MKKQHILIITIAVVSIAGVSGATALLLRQQHPKTPETTQPAQSDATPRTPKNLLEERALDAEKQGSTAFKDGKTEPTPPTIQDVQDYSTMPEAKQSTQGSKAEASLQQQGTATPTTPPKNNGIGDPSN